jgi:cell wall-associated NlpC family hydrolase
MTADEIIAYARRWCRTPYRPTGRGPKGIDCLGLLVMVGRHFEIPHVDEPNYSMWPRADHLILRRCAEYLEVMPIQDGPAPGLVGVFGASAKLPGHAGIFAWKHDALSLIHARLAPPRVTEDGWEQMSRQEIRLIGLFRFPGMVG